MAELTADRIASLKQQISRFSNEFSLDLQKALDELVTSRKNAARYEYLRDNCLANMCSGGYTWIELRVPTDSGALDPTVAILEASIDAALEAE